MEAQVNMGCQARATEAARVSQGAETTDAGWQPQGSARLGLEEIPVGLEEEFHEVFEEKRTRVTKKVW